MDFITKKKGRGVSSYDISIKPIKDSHQANRNRVSITVRNRCERKIALGGYTVVAIEKNRLYFSNANQSIGFKLTKSNTHSENSNYQICISDTSLVKYATRYRGSYDLLFDKELNYWYIEGVAVN